MAVNASLAELLKELLAPLGQIGVRRMFGGAGVYCDGLMIGLIAADTLYFKADDANRAAYEAEGMEPFTYAAKGKTVEIGSYWRVPERLLDEPEEMVEWGRAALAAARRSAAGKKHGGRRRTRPGAAPV
jgi:DNA transformation protein and related proteins